MRSYWTGATLLCSLLFIAGAPLTAQQRGQGHEHQTGDTTGSGGMMQMMGMMSCPMMSAMMRGSAAALRARDTLRLSATQVGRLEVVQREIAQAHRRMMDSMRVLQPRIVAVTDASRFDERAARSLFDRMGHLHTEMAVSMLRAQHATAGILTPEQRDSLAALGRAHMGMAGMAGRGQAGAGSPGCPMMQPASPSHGRRGVKKDTLDSLHSHVHRGDTATVRP